MLTSIIEREKALEGLFHRAAKIQSDDDVPLEVKSGFALFLCIRTYVYFEASVVDILSSYVQATPNDSRVARFAESHLRSRSRRNLKREELLGLISQFSDDWRTSIRNSTEGRLKDSLDSIVNHRNKIAHGDLDLEFLTFSGVSLYFDDLKAIIRIVYETCSFRGSNS